MDFQFPGSIYSPELCYNVIYFTVPIQNIAYNNFHPYSEIRPLTSIPRTVQDESLLLLPPRQFGFTKDENND